MTRAVVTENTKTPMAIQNVTHTTGSSEQVQPRRQAAKAHCATRKSNEKMMRTSPRTPKPTRHVRSVSRSGQSPRLKMASASYHARRISTHTYLDGATEYPVMRGHSQPGALLPR